MDADHGPESQPSIDPSQEGERGWYITELEVSYVNGTLPIATYVIQTSPSATQLEERGS